MTSTSSPDPGAGRAPADEADDQAHVHHGYGHGRMPLFMKIAWLAFLAFGAWYVVAHLLAALAEEIGGAP